MATPSTRYRRAPVIPESVGLELNLFSPLVQQLLYARGVVTRADADAFFAPQYETLHDPFLITDMEKVVTRILAALANGEHIVVYSDYDCDGIPGGVVLHDFFYCDRLWQF